ncbi:Fe-S oxidoreductase [Spirochaetia bacterium]|nr:Fe-S oxidoreductase [Spirochaetia bacterium]
MKKLGFGLMRLPVTCPGNQKSIDQETLNKMADRFIEQGFTYFDTAYPYHEGMSEGAFRKAVADRYPREQFTIADKMPVWLVKGSADYQRIFAEQLSRCGVGYFDYYMLHALDAERYPETVKFGGFEFIKKLKADGKAKHIGFSFHDKADVLDKILSEHPEVDFVQLQINYIDWDDKGIQSRKCHETALKHGTPVVVMEPVKGGCLASLPEEADKLFKAHNANAGSASWAIRFAASLDKTIVVLSGMSSFEQLADNAAFMRDFKPLNDEERVIIKKAAEIISANIAIPCTGCMYCVEGCPQKIPIPRYFSLYNNQKQYGLIPSIIGSYAFASDGVGKAKDCIACKQCEEHCPQHIAIADNLKEVAKVFER